MRLVIYSIYFNSLKNLYNFAWIEFQCNLIREYIEIYHWNPEIITIWSPELIEGRFGLINVTKPFDSCIAKWQIIPSARDRISMDIHPSNKQALQNCKWNWDIVVVVIGWLSDRWWDDVIQTDVILATKLRSYTWVPLHIGGWTVMHVVVP